jgi:predicted lipoprotein with Yx(FWY)xxD motif
MNRGFQLSKIFQPARIAGLLILAAVVLAACAPAATPVPTAVPTEVSINLPAPTATSAPVATTAPAAAAAPEASINIVTDAKFGKILVDGKGMTLYMYTKDEANKVNCAAGCLKAWPPLLTQGSPTLGDGVDAALVGTADVGNGTKIVTYNKMPLYYYAKDAKAGDLSGVGVGTVWYLVSPDGKVIGK